jgi:RNA polymerase-binding transcription factor DksA
MAGDVVSTDVRASLEAERTELLAELSGVGDKAGDHYDANFADSSQVTAERGEAEALASKLRATLADVERALVKLDEGTYGECEQCHKPIGEARMEAMPTARRCISCASKR